MMRKLLPAQLREGVVMMGPLAGVGFKGSFSLFPERTEQQGPDISDVASNLDT